MQCRARRESVLGGFHEWFRRHLGDDDLVVSQMRRPGLDPESVGDLGKASPRSSDEIGKTPSLASPRVRSIPMASRQSGSVRRSPVSLPRAGARFRRSCAAFPRALSEQAERLLPRRLEAMTANTITSRALVEGLDRIAQSGVAYDREERTERIFALGTAVHRPVTANPAITVVAPTQRFNLGETRGDGRDRILGTTRRWRTRLWVQLGCVIGRQLGGHLLEQLVERRFDRRHGRRGRRRRGPRRDDGSRATSSAGAAFNVDGGLEMHG